MKKQVLIIAAVLAAVVSVLWLKWEKPPQSPPVAVSGEGTRATVLLFADPREAEESCGCAEIIHMVRDLRGTPGVQVREIDPQRASDEARRLRVRTSPAVILLDAAGREIGRFEGESPSTIASLRSALASLRRSTTSASGTRQP